VSFRKRLAAGMAALLLVTAGAATGAAAEGAEEEAAMQKIFPFPVHEQVLDNGLKVVVIPYDSPGIVAYFTVVRTGSRQEVEAGHSGFAHFFEHMMFRGTERFSQEAYNDVLRGMGADSNAFTTDDWTGYYIVGPAAELGTMFDLESDRFKNLEYSEDGFRTEALAVLGEYNKNASSPFLPMFERLRELAFARHTYQHTTLGFLEDVEAMPGYYDYSLAFFDRFYRPENTIVLVVGDAEPAGTFAMAKKYYGDWEKGFKPVTIPADPEPSEGKRAHIDWPNPTRPQLMMGYRVPAFDAASVDTAALDLIDQLLFSEAAPLYQELVVDKQWVDQLGGSASAHRDPYLFMITARVKSDDLVPKVEETIARHVAELQARPVDAARLERIKSHLRYGFALSLASANAVAFNAAQVLELTGEVEPLNTLYATYETIGPKDVQRVAKAYFQPQRLTTVTLAYAAPKVEEDRAEDDAMDATNDDEAGR